MRCFRGLFLFTRIRAIYHTFPVLFPLFSHAKRPIAYRTYLGFTVLTTVEDSHTDMIEKIRMKARKIPNEVGSFYFNFLILPSGKKILEFVVFKSGRYFSHPSLSDSNLLSNPTMSGRSDHGDFKSVSIVLPQYPGTFSHQSVTSVSSGRPSLSNHSHSNFRIHLSS